MIVKFPVSPDLFQARLLARRMMDLNLVERDRLLRKECRRVAHEAVRAGALSEEMQSRVDQFHDAVVAEFGSLSIEGRGGAPLGTQS